MNWEQILDRDKLLELAGNRSFSAGEVYFRAGFVSALLVGDKAITAKVQGSERYHVQLDINDDGDLWGDCSCPYGEDGNFCKHCVAVGLAHLDGMNCPEESSQSITVSSLKSYLNTLSKEQLVEMLLEQASDDSDLQNRFLLKIAQSSPNGPDMAAYKKSLDRAISTQGYIDYKEVGAYSNGISDVIQSLEELYDSGFASEARQLTELAIDQLREEQENIDDSDGEVGMIWQDLHTLHLNTALASPGDPTELAKWLFQREMVSDWYVEGAWDDYLPALGEVGEAMFRNEAEKRWAAVPQLNPNDKSSYSSGRFQLTKLMLSFASTKEDHEAMIAIKKRDLSGADDFLGIAKLYLEAGDADKALEWAENGNARFSSSPPERLLDFLVEQYTQLGRYSDAYSILWKSFQDMPVLKHYQTLHDFAQARSEWERWREQCWVVLRDHLERSKEKNPPNCLWSRQLINHSEMVGILLWENRNEEAWQEAKTDLCSKDIWMSLASTREIDHPEDSIRLYQEEIHRLIEPTTNGDYSSPMRYLVKVQKIMQRTDQEDKFNSYLFRLRLEFKRKRNLLKLLDQF